MFKCKQATVYRPRELIVAGEKRRTGEDIVGKIAGFLIPVGAREQQTLTGLYGIVTHKFISQQLPLITVNTGDELDISGKRYKIVAPPSIFDTGTVLDRMELLLEEAQ